jgi:hypothetical protein
MLLLTLGLLLLRVAKVDEMLVDSEGGILWAGTPPSGGGRK